MGILSSSTAAQPTHKTKNKQFSPEAEIWYENLPNSGIGDLLSVNITLPGLSMLYPDVHCVADLTVCQVTTGEAEINAASSIMALVLSGRFDLTKTYFMVAGIAGVNPKEAALGSVALSRYAVQVAQQYEFDAREMPENFTTGYLPYGTFLPGQYPTHFYGSEVFEVNAALRDIAFGYASKATLNASDEAQAYGERYGPSGAIYAAATGGPSVVKCDTATSDVYYSGTLLSEAFENTTTSWTNGSGVYCMTAQEDNATLEVLLRMAISGLVDFARIIVMRTGERPVQPQTLSPPQTDNIPNAQTTGSDFDRPPPGVSAYDNLRVVDQDGYEIAVANIYLAGVEVVKGVLANWDCTFEKGVKPTNYIGDVFGSLPGKPDFGPGSQTDGKGYRPGGKQAMRKRGVATLKARAVQ